MKKPMEKRSFASEKFQPKKLHGDAGKWIKKKKAESTF